MMNRMLPAAGLVLAFVVFFIYISPTYSGPVTTIQATIAREQLALNAAASFGDKQKTLAEEKNRITPEDIARLETLLPSSVDNVSAILSLTALAARSGVQISSISVPQPTQGAGDVTTPPTEVGSIDMTFSATGSYQAFRTFITGIEHSTRLLDVTNLTVKGSDTGVYGYDMTVRLYWLR